MILPVSHLQNAQNDRRDYARIDSSVGASSNCEIHLKVAEIAGFAPCTPPLIELRILVKRNLSHRASFHIAATFRPGFLSNHPANSRQLCLSR
jgi:hypothetical protein